MDAAELERRMEREREFWVEVAPGKRLKLLRPLMDEGAAFANDYGARALAKYLRGWEGITEADLSAKGAATPAEFNLAVATLALRDNPAWTNAAAMAIFEAMKARFEATQVAEKNSPTS